MSLFDVILVQPIFNLLLFIYGIIPGHDFGIAIILFTIIVRLIMWPLVRKQLHHTKAIRALQPELVKIKKQAKGNKQLEAKLNMELYKEKSINPFSPIGLLIVQLPIFIALFAVVRLISDTHGANISKYAYGFLEKLPYVQDVIKDQSKLNHVLFGFVDLTKQAFGPGYVYLPLIIMALVAAGLQFWQSKQLLPEVSDKRKLRDILKDQAEGKQVDQAEMSAILSNRMIYLFPVLTLVFSIYLAGGLVLYLLVTSAMAIYQQSLVLKQDNVEMSVTSKNKPQIAKIIDQAVKAEIVNKPVPAKKQRRKKR